MASLAVTDEPFADPRVFDAAVRILEIMVFVG